MEWTQCGRRAAQPAKTAKEATMPDVKKILCAVDFSGATPLVADYAAVLAKALDAEILALYVAPKMNRYAEIYISGEELDRVVEAITEGSRKQMEELLNTSFKDVKATGVVKVGYPPEAILETRQEENCDMVVMGTHGRQGLGSVLFGSVAEKVVKNAKVPVLTVRPEHYED
jgi:nucleotide-binding universal stress UspA family protein